MSNTTNKEEAKVMLEKYISTLDDALSAVRTAMHLAIDLEADKFIEPRYSSDICELTEACDKLSDVRKFYQTEDKDIETSNVFDEDID